MHNKLHCIFVGRLVREKWFDLVLDRCHRCAADPALCDVFHLDIFGDGALRGLLEEHLEERDFVTYHGHRPLEEVKKIWSGVDYTLMPSRFLETFGLSALDAIQLGVPVVAPLQGGLAQFGDAVIPCGLTPATFATTMQALTQRHKQDENRTYDHMCAAIASQYTKEIWLARFQELSWLAPGAHVVLVSDFIVNVWGIEQYIFHVGALLEDAWYTVDFVGCANERHAKKRFWWLFSTVRNIQARRMLKETYNKKTPDLVRRHSVQRRLGPAGIFPYPTAQHRVMYHDFWLFHPYPSAVTSQKQVERSASFIGYIAEAVGSKFLHVPLALLKRCSSIVISSRLRTHIDRHLVPSVFMKSLLVDHGIPADKVTTLSHMY